MSDNDNQMSELSEHGVASGSTIDRRLEQTDDDLDEIRSDLDRLRASIEASLDGDHERAAKLLDELDVDDRPGGDEGPEGAGA